MCYHGTRGVLLAHLALTRLVQPWRRRRRLAASCASGAAVLYTAYTVQSGWLVYVLRDERLDKVLVWDEFVQIIGLGRGRRYSSVGSTSTQGNPSSCACLDSVVTRMAFVTGFPRAAGCVCGCRRQDETLLFS